MNIGVHFINEMLLNSTTSMKFIQIEMTNEKVKHFSVTR